MTNILEGRLTRSMREDMAENRATTAQEPNNQVTTIAIFHNSHWANTIVRFYREHRTLPAQYHPTAASLRRLTSVLASHRDWPVGITAGPNSLTVAITPQNQDTRSPAP